MSLTSYL